MNRAIIVILLLNTILLGSMTFLQGPLTKIADNLTKKYQEKALAKMCYLALQKKEDYLEYSRGMFISGCLWKTREDLMNKYTDPKQREIIEDVFKKQESMEFDKVSIKCQQGASDYQLQGKIPEKMISAVYYDMGCDALGVDKIIQMEYDERKKEEK